MFRDRAAAGADGEVLVRSWLQAAFALLVVIGWFIFALWIIASVAQIAVIQQHGTACTVAANLEVTCDPHA